MDPPFQDIAPHSYEQQNLSGLLPRPDVVIEALRSIQENDANETANG